MADLRLIHVDYVGLTRKQSFTSNEKTKNNKTTNNEQEKKPKNEKHKNEQTMKNNGKMIKPTITKNEKKQKN